MSELINKLKNNAEKELTERLEAVRADTEPGLFSAMEYALLGGGKRVRPVLTQLSALAFSVPVERVLPLAAALECIHAYSLIHDDLPAMDNDDFRRGKPTVHKAFGEASAILAGDSLLNLAYEILAETVINDPEAAGAAAFISKAAGSRGMAGGQAEELALSQKDIKDIDIPDILSMYSKKTGSLITAAVFAPYLLSGKTKDQNAVYTVASSAGLIFQLVDDIIDFNEGKDLGKITAVTVKGIDFVKGLIAENAKKAQAAFDTLGSTAEPLKEYFYFLLNRII